MKFARATLVAITATACAPTTMLYGAKTLEPGQVEGVLGVGVVGEPDFITEALAEGTGASLPFGLRADYGGRVGLIPDLDLGWRVYTAGAGADVRYRFFRNERLHLATAPGFVVSALPPTPSQSATLSLGLVEFRTPLLAEVDITKWWALSGGAHLIFRNQFLTNNTPELALGTNRLDIVTNVGLRTEFHSRRFGVALAGEYSHQPIRKVSEGFSGSLQFVFRSDPFKKRLDKSAKGAFKPRAGGQP